jgi:hypothetical protein
VPTSQRWLGERSEESSDVHAYRIFKLLWRRFGRFYRPFGRGTTNHGSSPFGLSETLCRSGSTKVLQSGQVREDIRLSGHEGFNTSTVCHVPRVDFRAIGGGFVIPYKNGEDGGILSMSTFQEQRPDKVSETKGDSK